MVAKPVQPRNPRKLLRVVPDCTDRSGLGKSTIFRAIETGELPAHRFGRAVRVDEGDLERWLEAHRVPALQAVRATGDVETP